MSRVGINFYAFKNIIPLGRTIDTTQKVEESKNLVSLATHEHSLETPQAAVSLKHRNVI